MLCHMIDYSGSDTLSRAVFSLHSTLSPSHLALSHLIVSGLDYPGKKESHCILLIFHLFLMLQRLLPTLTEIKTCRE